MVCSWPNVIHHVLSFSWGYFHCTQRIVQTFCGRFYSNSRWFTIYVYIYIYIYIKKLFPWHLGNYVIVSAWFHWYNPQQYWKINPTSQPKAVNTDTKTIWDIIFLDIMNINYTQHYVPHFSGYIHVVIINHIHVLLPIRMVLTNQPAMVRQRHYFSVVISLIIHVDGNWFHLSITN